MYKAYYETRLRLLELMSDGLPILVYSMGKTGTQTICKSLELMNSGGPVYHTHRLSENGIKEEEYKRKITNNPYQKTRNSILTNKYLHRKIIHVPQSEKWRVVTLVRDPLSRNISAFFQELKTWAPGILEIYEKGENVVESLIDIFFSKFNHDIPLHWFDKELKEVFGIDVFAHPFHTGKGYQIYENKSSSVFLIRLENLNSCAEEAFRAFIGSSNFSLVMANLSSDKSYYNLYRDFRNRFKPPDGYLDKMYNSKFAQHFYAAHEISKFKESWKNPRL